MKIISKKTVIPALIIIGIAVIILVIGSPEKQENDTDDSIIEVPVRVSELKLGSLELTTGITGVLRSRYEIPIMSEIGGTVIRKVREIGDPVPKGESVVLLDPEPYELAFAQAEAAFLSARAANEQAQRDFKRAEELRASEDISQYELENAHLGAATAEANLQMAEAAMKLARRNLRLTGMPSPIDGVVADLDVLIGQQVAPGAPLGMIVSLDDIEVEIGVSERDIVRIKQGNEVQIRTDALPDQIFIGRVRSVGVAGLGISKSFPVIISVDNDKGALKPGMIVDMEITYKRCEKVLAIPRSALILSGEFPKVYVAADGRAIPKVVTLGQASGTDIIIESGLEPGEELIISGQKVLSDCTVVKIL